MGKMNKNRDSAAQMMHKQMALMEKDMNCDKKIQQFVQAENLTFGV